MNEDDDNWYMGNFSGRFDSVVMPKGYTLVFDEARTDDAVKALKDEETKHRAVTTHSRRLSPLEAMALRRAQSLRVRAEGRKCVQEFFETLHKFYPEPVDGVKIVDIEPRKRRR